jgi:AraC-like DNA-binding protein
VLGTDPGLQPADPAGIVDAAARDGWVTHNGGAEVVLVGARFSFSGNQAAMLFDTVPPIVGISSESSEAEVLRWSLDRLASELRDERPGSSLIWTHLVQLMLAHTLRLYLERSTGIPKGWFSALTDLRIGASIKAIHATPAHHWTLEALARVSCLSRSAFTTRFKALTGDTPMDYLMHWRMLIGADRLRKNEENVSTIAFSLGYKSESAFSAAFKRKMSCSPTRYRQQFSASSCRTSAAKAH